MPTTDAMKVQTVVMIRYAPHWDPESVSCTMKTHKTFTAVDKIITGIMPVSYTHLKVTDLPGVYSLSPYTLEEVVSRDYILNEDPDVIINLVDATNIERNLYLTTQLTETGVPVVIALNMACLLYTSRCV